MKLNSSPPIAACMHQWTRSALVQVMACCLFGIKPLPEPMLAYCQLHSWEQISVKFESELRNFHWRKCLWNYYLPKWRPFCPRGDELIAVHIWIQADKVNESVENMHWHTWVWHQCLMMTIWVQSITMGGALSASVAGCNINRADSRLAPSQWEMALESNVSTIRRQWGQII